MKANTSVRRYVEQPEAMARELVSECERVGAGAELVYPTKLGGKFCVIVDFEVDIDIRFRVAT